ncbi:BCCT family transporter, partial [Marivita sp.]|uniref:BCCT family transporter n=1 Tax=Marivita sp. TaxID=2003365 RepID=UPI0025BFB218
MADETTDTVGIRAPEGDTEIIETDYRIGQDNITAKVGPFGLDIHNPVFLISGLAVVMFVFYALALPDQAEGVFSWLFSSVTQGFDWFFLAAANIFVIFCLVLIVSPFGSVRLGGSEATPDYGYLGWFAMLFAAGMGIGLLFFGVSEPMSHFSSSLGGTAMEGDVRTDWAPVGGAVGDEAAAQRLGMAATIFHWGLHPWAIYAVVALALALFSYNKGLPLTLRSAFYPLLGDRVWGWTGHIIDIVAVFATLFGLATSLGYGASSIPAEVLRRAMDRFGPVFTQGFGMTELAGNVVFMSKSDHVRAARDAPGLLLAAGRVGALAEVRIVDENGEDCPTGEPGEIVVRGDQVLSGYWNRPQANAEAFRGGWFLTGDMARMDDEGFVYIVDRKKDMIVSGAENVYPREVEEALYQHPAVAEAAVFGMADEHWGERVAAAIVVKPGAS